MIYGSQWLSSSTKFQSKFQCLLHFELQGVLFNFVFLSKAWGWVNQEIERWGAVERFSMVWLWKVEKMKWELERESIFDLGKKWSNSYIHKVAKEPRDKIKTAVAIWPRKLNPLKWIEKPLGRTLPESRPKFNLKSNLMPGWKYCQGSGWNAF